jgi:hypothetical protein
MNFSTPASIFVPMAMERGGPQPAWIASRPSNVPAKLYPFFVSHHRGAPHPWGQGNAVGQSKEISKIFTASVEHRATANAKPTKQGERHVDVHHEDV